MLPHAAYSGVKFNVSPAVTLKLADLFITHARFEWIWLVSCGLKMVLGCGTMDGILVLFQRHAGREVDHR